MYIQMQLFLCDDMHTNVMNLEKIKKSQKKKKELKKENKEMNCCVIFLLNFLVAIPISAYISCLSYGQVIAFGFEDNATIRSLTPVLNHKSYYISVMSSLNFLYVLAFIFVLIRGWRWLSNFKNPTYEPSGFEVFMYWYFLLIGLVTATLAIVFFIDLIVYLTYSDSSSSLPSWEKAVCYIETIKYSKNTNH